MQRSYVSGSASKEAFGLHVAYRCARPPNNFWHLHFSCWALAMPVQLSLDVLRRQSYGRRFHSTHCESRNCCFCCSNRVTVASCCCCLWSSCKLRAWIRSRYAFISSWYRPYTLLLLSSNEAHCCFIVSACFHDSASIVVNDGAWDIVCCINPHSLSTALFRFFKWATVAQVKTEIILLARKIRERVPCGRNRKKLRPTAIH